MIDDLKQAAADIAGTVVEWRRDLHQHPELGFEEHRTAAFVASRLQVIGVDVLRTGVAKTGVIGVIEAPSPRRPAVLLRADMDALPIQEVSGRAYGSKVPGKMHACGHDGHTAMLLGAATLLAARKSGLDRNVVLCFQPAEEGLGGAAAMIGEGILDEHGVGEVYGLHLWSLFPSGTIHIRAGAVMAAQDEFVATFHGRGGHGAAPQLCVDPVLAAAHGLVALQSIVARSVDPLHAAVVSVGSLHGGTAPNVIPDDARMHGTLRSFDADDRETLRRRVKDVLEGVAAAAGCRLEFELRPGFPAVVNSEGVLDRVRAAAARVVGSDRVIDLVPMAAAEDFAFFLQARPGAFIFLGAGHAARGIIAPHHATSFDIDEDALPRGVELLARLALG